MGRVDRVDRFADGSFHIIDYKTGNSTQEEDFQLFVYAVLLHKKFQARISKVSYLLLNARRWQSIEPTNADLSRAEEELFAARDEMLAEHEFSARPNRLCHWCDFIDLCDAQVSRDWDCSPSDEPPF